jgi:uncharacterized protein YbgA (DUF1722 family)/uncharacterized protein YbbK (DUF523 family)
VDLLRRRLTARAPSVRNVRVAASLRIGVSACLVGDEVRFDGRHKRDAFLADELAPFVTWVRVCPEVEVGMGVPREPVRLVRGARGRTLMQGVQSGADWTARMRALAERRVRALAAQELSGYVLKSKSPSCGLERVELFDAARPAAAPRRDGVGLFARALLGRLPNLPVEDEARLGDDRLRESWLERVFAYARVRRLWRPGPRGARWSVVDLVAFHTAHKMQLLAHSTEGYRALGRLVARARTLPRARVRAEYEAGFMGTLGVPATPGRHANALTHMLGHLKRRLDDRDRRELLGLIEAHGAGRVPLVAPLTLLAHHARRLSVAYLLGQTYLEPDPRELLLRNHV